MRGIAAWRQHQPLDVTSAVTDDRGRRAAARPRRRARSGASPFAARSAGPAVTEQAPFDVDGHPFPTQFYVTCPHLVAAISRLEAAGGVERWTRAAEEDDELARSLADAQAEQRRAAAGARRRHRRLDAHRQPQVPARARGVRARAAGLRARRPDPRRAARALAGLLLYCATLMDVELARQQWQDGNRRVEDARPDDRYVDLTQQVDVVVAALRQRVGQVFTLGELADAYDGADDWARELLDDAATRRASDRRGRHGRRRRLPPLRPRRDGLPPVIRWILARGRRARARVRARAVGLGEALHDNPKPGGTQTLDPDAGAAAARAGRPRNGDGYGSKTSKRFR